MRAFLRYGLIGLSVSSLAIPVLAADRERSPVELDRVVGAQTLDRVAYVRAVLALNPSIESARQSWRAALARVRQAGAFQDPMIDVSVAPLSIGSSQARFGYEVGLRQELPWFGKRALERDVMAAEAAASQSDLELTRRELAMAALTLYDEYFVAARSLEINAQHVLSIKALQDAAAAQLEAGRGSTQEALQAEVELAQLERDALRLASERDVAVAQMNELLHREPGSPLPAPAQELVVLADVGSEGHASLAREALAKRAEIAAARQRARAQTLRADAADREYLPSITLTTSYSSMWDMAQHRWMVGVGINLPLPTEQRAAAVDEARAAHAQYESEVARMSDLARTQVYVALRKMSESQDVLRLFRSRLLPVARAQIDAVRTDFTSARASFSAVIDAERNLRNVELEHQTAQAEWDRRHAELERALGRVPGLSAAEQAP